MRVSCGKSSWLLARSRWAAERPMSHGGQQPHVVPWDRPVWRVARRTDPVAFSRIEAAEATVDAGNRFDVRGGAVLYTGGSLECCFVETMARLRTSPAVVQAVGCDEHYMNPDTVPISWRTNRCIVTVAPVEGGLLAVHRPGPPRHHRLPRSRTARATRSARREPT